MPPKIIIFSLYLLISGVTFLYLLHKKLIRDFIFCYLVLICLASVPIFWNLNKIQKFLIETKAGSMLAEMRGIQKDVYAKAENVKNLTEKIADISAYNLSSIGRFASDDLYKEIQSRKEQLIKLMKDADIKNEKINQITSQVNRVIIIDLKQRITDDLRTNPLQSEGKTDNRSNELISILGATSSELLQEELNTFVNNNKIENIELKEKILTLVFFLKHKSLPNR